MIKLIQKHHRHVAYLGGVSGTCTERDGRVKILCKDTAEQWASDVGNGPYDARNGKELACVLQVNKIRYNNLFRWN